MKKINKITFNALDALAEILQSKARHDNLNSIKTKIADYLVEHKDKKMINLYNTVMLDKKINYGLEILNIS